MKSLYTCWLPLLAASSLLPALACNDSHGGTGKGRALSPARAVGPQFPGAGRSGAGLALSAGNVTVSCDQQGPIPGGSFGPAPGAVAHQDCYFDATHPDDPAATMEWIVEAAEQGDLVHARLTFNPRFVDNTYGANAIGWDGSGVVAPDPMPGKPGKPAPAPKPGKSGHTFKDLVGSDHAEFTISDGAGVTKLKFKADYLTESAAAPSGYASLGVSGGEGKMLVGNASAVVAVSTSLDRNLNACGLGDFLIDSPATDASYTPNHAAPNWDFRVVYDVWIDAAVFAGAGFGRASVEFVHASPSKAGSNTIEVTPGECPPSWPPYCSDPDGCGEPPPECGDLLDELCTPTPACDGGDCQPPDAGPPVLAI